MSDQPLVQVSTPIRQGELPQVVVRADDVPDLLTAEQVLEQLKDAVLEGMAEVVTLLKGSPANTQTAMANLAQAGLGPLPIPPSTPSPAPATPAPPTAGISQCPACSRPTSCPDCKGPTTHGNKAAKANPAGYNAHLCAANPTGHKVVWCKTPIKEALRVATGNNPALIYG